MLGWNIGYVVRAILAFLSTRLLPSSYNSKVYAPTILLLYAIYNRMSNNVGRTINTNIQTCKLDLNVRSIIYPSIITMLVREDGVNQLQSCI